MKYNQHINNFIAFWYYQVILYLNTGLHCFKPQDDNSGMIFVFFLHISMCL